MGPLIAVVGADGSGKSTVCEALLAWLQESGPAELCHLGIQSDNLARAIGRLPLIGRLVERKVRSKVKKAENVRGVGPLEAFVIYLFALRRLRRFRRMLKRRRTGATILTDRFPQLAFPPGLDGPGFARVKADSTFARWLAKKEWQLFEWMTSQPPDLVLRLNIDVETATARKPDHAPELLAKKIASIPKLGFGAAPVIDIDATRPLDEVLAQAKTAIAERVQR